MIKKYNQTGITVKIHTNHAGVRATAITLRSIAASSAIFGYRSEASLRNYIGRPSSEKIRACSDILSLKPSFAELSSRAIFMFR